MSTSRRKTQQAAKTDSKAYAHFLIGTPGSGKSTFAELLCSLGNYEIISTDEIRQELYGDATIQGQWQTIEATVINRICTAFSLGKSVIYDATNYKHSFRMDFLLKVKTQLTQWELPQLQWIGWYLKTPWEICISWNQQRQRQVPPEIIKNMYTILQESPPITDEGFAVVNNIDVSSLDFSPHQITKLIAGVPRQIVNFQNRHAKIIPHRYSYLLDFERLMYLICLIINYPGIGELHLTKPQLLENIFGYIPDFANSLEEITGFMAKMRGDIYARKDAVAADLVWLEAEGIINSNLKVCSEDFPKFEPDELMFLSATHSYSDKKVFGRLMGTIRFIFHYPFLADIGIGSLNTLLRSLEKEGVINNYRQEKDKIRKDIEKVLKPYKILPEFPMRHGYFAGTGILSKPELIKVFDIIQSQANSLNDPQALEIYEIFKQRLLQTRTIENTENIYPVRAIANSSIVDPKHLHSSALSNNLSQLETAIVEGRLLELKRLAGVGRYEGDEKDFFFAYPLQIIFSNLAWYLGYECVSGETSGLLRFERLDRLFLGKPQSQQRSREAQEKVLHKLQQLFKSGAGMHLGNSSIDQQQFLSTDKQERMQVCVMVELWFNDQIYPFITEGTKRFANMKMSPPLQKTRSNLSKSLFCLTKTGDRNFPHRFQAIFPKWTLDDFDLRRWIIGFGGSVKVVAPQELVEKIKEIGQGIVANYET
ncbi:WYL domain-containing protein [Nodularia harveyana UHCC-0300]|uniref:WYL domain-containing protein n=1 Tax=Nodularia harveyana UHCC-0300 TaxID=2974287 RepID=A0ABU5UG28_9CYAN|nr:WYL domain-containing protein [Nodularia harveyana]MEA5582467.1 WYL domain-containing protein [Nodularia harveyana UHCC-0300]